MKLFKTYSEKEVKRVMPIVKQINDLEGEVSKLSDSELRGKTDYFKKLLNEGKTLVATLPVYLNALEGEGVHVITVNDYLAKRDSEWMGKLYKFLGLSVGLVINGMDPDQKYKCYIYRIRFCFCSSIIITWSYCIKSWYPYPHCCYIIHWYNCTWGCI